MAGTCPATFATSQIVSCAAGISPLTRPITAITPVNDKLGLNVTIYNKLDL